MIIVKILAAFKALMECLLSMLGAHNATQESKEIIQLETRLANVTVSEYDDQRKNMSTMYNRITPRQLQRIAPGALNAYYLPNKNQMVFTADILQPAL